MITVQELLEQSRHQALLEQEKKAKLELSRIKKRIVEQLAVKIKDREEMFGHVNIGDIVENNGSKFEVVKVESSYVTVINEQGELLKKWLNEIFVTGSNTDNRISINESGQVAYKGYNSKHVSKELAEHLQSKRQFNRFLMISFLTNYDAMMEEQDLNKQKRLVEQVMSHAIKLQIPFDEVINQMDDKMIVEGAQGNISYTTPCTRKIRNLLSTLEVNKYKDNSIIQNLQAMIRS